jgi:hypothetical protein
MQDFWRSCAYQKLRRDANGALRPSEDFFRAYLERPELVPVEESCSAERALHAALLDRPLTAIDEMQLGAILDPDMRDNYRIWLRFRDRLLAAGSVEAFYVQHFLGRHIDIPPLMLDHLAQLILRSLLDGTEDAILVRSAELFFRRQAASLQDGAVLLADAATVEMYQNSGGFGNVGRLLVQSDMAPRELKLEVLNINNAILYWMRDERFDTVLDISPGREAPQRLCRLLESWVEHLLGVRVKISAVTRIEDERWVWHCGLDVESSAILNELYEGREVTNERLRRLIGLFRMDFEDSAEMRNDLAGRPVYLGLAVDADMTLRLKPQNLLLNLPLARLA